MPYKQTLCILLLGLAACKDDGRRLFREVEPGRSGISFTNRVQEDAMINMLTYEYLYNGGGVGIGDFNNDGRPDIYFTASLGPNALYLNEGGMRFRDATREAGVDGMQRWSRGVAVVDINNDGLQDIYVCAGTWQQPERRRNLLYVNQGVDPATATPRFAEMGAAYGVDDTTNTQMAAFFDYDNDGDLDLYLLVNDLGREKPNTFRPVRSDGSAHNNDRLLRNDWDPDRQHAVYRDVSRAAGITWEGYGLGVGIVDINDDGWKDVLVSNDYLSGDILYVNNRDGTFTNRVQEYFGKGSLNAMGNDAADINNDGLVDVIETDMAGEDNRRFKMMMNPLDYNWYRYTRQYGLQYQTVRNTLQLNRGPRPLPGDSLGEPFFSEIAFLSGVAYTDWSWAPLLADLDQDGYRDLMVTNGLPKDITDNDYIAYREQGGVQPEELLLRQPPVQTSNYLFRNNGDLVFSDATREWGWEKPTFSNGMAYADFDGDGDLDVVVNNINQPAGLWENTIAGTVPGGANYVRFRVRGDTANLHGLGTMVRIHYGGSLQAGELSPYRGYLSSVEPVLHFGLGAATRLDSVVVRWPDGKTETLRDVAAGQTHLLSQAADARREGPRSRLNENRPLLQDASARAGIYFMHAQEDFADFEIQRALPHRFSSLAPPLAAADLNGDRLDDLVVGGNPRQRAFIYFQGPQGRFTAKYFNGDDRPQRHEDAAVAAFDAEGDGDADIYLAAGGARFPSGDSAYADRLWLNDGKGFFSAAPGDALPDLRVSESAVRTADVDGDGRIDILLCGRVLPGRYPFPADSRLLRNESSAGRPRFRDVTQEAAPGLLGLGIVNDARWADMDGDRDPDLLVAGEWMGVQLFINEGGRLTERRTDMAGLRGWWNTLLVADADGDGDPDILAGNHGRNSFFRADAAHPLRAYAADYDGNGFMNVLLSHYRPTAPHGRPAEFPVALRDAMVEELPTLRKHFPLYADYAGAGMQELLAKFDRSKERVWDAFVMESGWFRNEGKGGFRFLPFPVEAQLAPVKAMHLSDFDGDGRSDILLAGNDGSMATVPGRSDAFCGLLLRGVAGGGFEPMGMLRSGWFLPGEYRQLQPLWTGEREALFAAGPDAPLRLFMPRSPSGVK